MSEPGDVQGATAVPRRRVARYDADTLLDVAVKVFTERGYDGTSMDQLAQAAGITKSSFYHHVQGKEELLSRSLSRALDGLFAILEESESREGPAIDRLVHVMRGTVGLLVNELPHVTLLLRVRGNTEVERHALERRREFQRAVTKLVEEAEQEGEIAVGDDKALVARLLFGMVNSVTEWYRPGGDLSATILADIVVALGMQGLRPRS